MCVALITVLVLCHLHFSIVHALDVFHVLVAVSNVMVLVLLWID